MRNWLFKLAASLPIVSIAESQPVLSNVSNGQYFSVVTLTAQPMVRSKRSVLWHLHVSFLSIKFVIICRRLCERKLTKTGVKIQQRVKHLDKN